MADTPTTTSTIALSSILAPELQEAFNRETVAAQVLPVRLGMNPTGPQWAVNKGGSVTRTHAAGSTVTNFESDSDVTASLGWGLYENAFKVHDEALAQAKASPFPQATRNLFAREVMGSVQSIAKAIEGDLFDGSGSNSIIGFDTALDSTSEYASIDRASASYWRGYEAAPGSLTTLTKALVVDDLAQIKIQSGERPNVAFCSPLVFAQVEKIFETQRRFIGGDAVLGTQGLPIVDVFGCRFVETAGDGYAADNNGAIYYVNTSYVHIEAMPYLEGDVFDTSAINGQSLVNFFNYKKLPFVGHATTGMVRCMAQLVVENPLKCGKRLDIDLS